MFDKCISTHFSPSPGRITFDVTVVLEVVVSITVDADCSAAGVYGGGGSTGTRGLGRDKRWCAGAGIDEL